MTKKTKIIIPFLIAMLFLSLFGINVSAETNTDNHINCLDENHSHEAELTTTGLTGNITLPEKEIIGGEPEIGVNCSHTVTRKNCYRNIHSQENKVLNTVMMTLVRCWTAIECDVCGSYLRTEGYHICYYSSHGIPYYEVDKCPY